MGRVLVSGLEAHVGFWLRFVSNHVSGRFRREVEASGVSVSEWVALRRLYGAGEVAPSVLMEALGMTKGAVSKIIARLAAKGLVERTGVSGDRRAHRVRLSRRGRQLVPRLARIADENDQLFFGHLTDDERAALSKLMMDIVRIHGLRDVPVD